MYPSSSERRRTEKRRCFLELLAGTPTQRIFAADSSGDLPSDKPLSSLTPGYEMPLRPSNVRAEVSMPAVPISLEFSTGFDSESE